MFPFKRKKRKHKPTPQWVMWLVVAFIGYSVFTNGNKTTTDKKIPDPNAVYENPEKISDTPEKTLTNKASEPIIDSKIINLEALKDKVFPQITIKLNVKDTDIGEGDPAICGQKATINYNSFTEDNKEIETDQKLTFQIGEGKAMPALEKGVVGMKKNGRRTITSPGEQSYSSEQSDRHDIPSQANIRFEAQLLDVSPVLPDFSAYRVIGDGVGTEEIYDCGSTVKLHVTIWSVDGKKLYSSKENDGAPISFTIGKSEVFLGLEQGILHMSADMRRNIIVPPSMQKTLNGNPPAINFPLPKNQTVLVDIESIP